MRASPAAATCYPRPRQQHVPVWVGGNGERRTLRLVARHADACNLKGDVAAVERCLAALRAHCADEGRDPASVHVSHLSTASVLAAGATRTHEGAAPLEDQVGRDRELAEAGVQTAVLAVPELGVDPKALARAAELVARLPRLA
jgi:alkanesulfonate monooxygenase SsuD/methylene tetrahydromethanopterin reductase-like flavin-dependent oxidoreductase (luciferase family)